MSESTQSTIQGVNSELEFDFEVDYFGSFKGRLELPLLLKGDSGTGKSTFLKCLAGLVKWKGDLSCCGVSFRSNFYRRIRQRYIAYLPQEVLFAAETVRDDVKWFKKVLVGFDGKKFEQFMERFKTLELVDKKWSELSGGEKKRISLCLMLSLDRKIYLFDEPLTGLDEKAIDEFKKIRKELFEAGKFYVLVSHIADREFDFEKVVRIDEIIFPKANTTKIEQSC